MTSKEMLDHAEVDLKEMADRKNICEDTRKKLEEGRSMPARTAARTIFLDCLMAAYWQGHFDGDGSFPRALEERKKRKARQT